MTYRIGETLASIDSLSTSLISSQFINDEISIYKEVF